MHLRNDEFHQYEMLQKITLIIGKIAEPWYMRMKGDQSLILSIIQQITRYKRKVNEKL